LFLILGNVANEKKKRFTEIHFYNNLCLISYIFTLQQRNISYVPTYIYQRFTYYNYIGITLFD